MKDDRTPFPRALVLPVSLALTYVQKQKHMMPVMNPMRMALMAPTEPAAGVMPTKPERAPEIIPRLEGRR